MCLVETHDLCAIYLVMTQPKVQHYVPAFMLRNFCAPTAKGRKVFVFDKHTRRSFSSNTKNVVCESRFYDFEHEGFEYSLEPTLSRIETVAQPIVDEILTSKRLPRTPACAEDMAVLAMFVAIQLARTPWQRERLAEVPALLMERLRSMDQRIGAELEEMLRTPDENTKKREGSIFLVNWAKRATPILIEKHWLLFSTTRTHPFLIGDNPVAKANATPGPPPFVRGNTGIASPGVEIYFPLSATLTLGLFCDSAVNQILDNARQLSGVPKHLINGDRELRDTKAKLDAFCNALNTGEAVPADEENVLHLNSLQVLHAERFLISSSSDFRLAQDMLAKNPMLKVGPRIIVG